MKPTSAERIQYTIERACKLRDLLRNEALKKTVAGIKNLPSLPKLYNLIVTEMQSPEASLKKVGYIISQDISMSAKILQLVNSPFFGLPQEITNPQQAAIYLGLDTLKALVLSIGVFSSFTGDAESCGFSLAKMWRHSLRTSKLARDIARSEMADEKVVEEAMIAGMLHDIGKLILLKVPRQYKKVMDFIERTGCVPVEAEYTVMKTSHAELGAYLLGLWGIPENIVEPIAFHHNPSKLLENMCIIRNESTREDLGKTKSEDVNLKPLSVKRYSRGFTALTAVHIANALMLQENCSSNTTFFPYVDMLYLRTLNLTDKLPEWVECYNNAEQQEVIGYV
jgi:putative nucleotidyltransferase with HDIG domain